jgi:hypothetical protein
MGLITSGEGNLSNLQVTVEDYSGDKGGQQLWSATGPMVGVSDHQITYNVYTKGRDSGAGVYGVWQGFNLGHVCADRMAGPNGIPNKGTRLARDKFDHIERVAPQVGSSRGGVGHRHATPQSQRPDHFPLEQHWPGRQPGWRTARRLQADRQHAAGRRQILGIEDGGLVRQWL